MNETSWNRCKVCGARAHWCFNCGDEAWHQTYCNATCMAADGRVECPICHGWAEHPEPGDSDYDPTKTAEALGCVDGHVPAPNAAA